MSNCKHEECQKHREDPEMQDVHQFQEKITAFLETLQPEAKEKKIAVVVVINQHDDKSDRMATTMNVGQGYARHILEHCLERHFKKPELSDLVDFLKHVLGVSKKRAG